MLTSLGWGARGQSPCLLHGHELKLHSQRRCTRGHSRHAAAFPPVSPELLSGPQKVGLLHLGAAQGPGVRGAGTGAVGAHQQVRGRMSWEALAFSAAALPVGPAFASHCNRVCFVFSSVRGWRIAGKIVSLLKASYWL